MRPCFWWDRECLWDKDGRLLAQQPCAAWWSPAPATGREPPGKGHKQAIEWDTRRVKGAKWSLGLILAECCIYAWESQPCLSPVAIQVLGWWKWWDFIAHMEEVRVLLQKSQEGWWCLRSISQLADLLAQPLLPQTKGLSHFLETE